MKYYNIQETAGRIRNLRISHGYTQEELARKLDVDRSFFSHIERGQKGCSVDLFVRLSDIFGVPPDYILTGRESGSNLVKESLNAIIGQMRNLRDML